MELWRMILIAIAIVVFIPTVTLMNQVNKLKLYGKSEELKKKQKQLTWCTRLLVVVFLIALAATMYLHYAARLAM